MTAVPSARGCLRPPDGRHIQPPMTEQTIIRRPLLSAELQDKTVTRVDVREIVFQPGQETGLHKHPCPVFGYIAEGEAVLQVEGKPSQHLSAGSAFYEPADTVIARFDNASAKSPMRFICYYLLNGEQELIEMLSV
jgi:quercetin dioxygenase-like cupin family protein